MKKILHKILQIKFHQILFGLSSVVFICIIRHIFLIQPLNLTSNIFLGIICFLSRLFFMDYLKEYLDELNINFDLAQILWGRNYLGGGENNITFSNKNIKKEPKYSHFMVNSNNANDQATHHSPSNATQDNAQLNPTPTSGVFSGNYPTLPPINNPTSTRGAPLNPVLPTFNNNPRLPNPFINPGLPNSFINPGLPNPFINPGLPNPGLPNPGLSNPFININRSFISIDGKPTTISSDGKWFLHKEKNTFSYLQSFNTAFEIYKTLPANEIMRDYDKLTRDIPRRDLRDMSDALRCVLKYAGSKNIFSQNNIDTLKGLGNDDKLVPGFNAKPKTLKPAVRRLIGEELIENREIFLSIINNRNR